MASERAIVAEAANRYGVSPSILWGVYGTETSFGKNLSTSSAGAEGPFQLEPATARGLGVNPHDFKSSAFGAAKYLSQFKGRGTGGMLSAYNAGPAGGYQADYVNKTLQNAKSFGDIVKGAQPGIEQAVQTGQHKQAVEQFVNGFDKQGYQEAAQHAAGERSAASLFTGGGEGDAALRSALEQAGKPPSPQSFGQQRVVKGPNGTSLMPSNSGAANSLTNAMPQGSKLAGFLPGNASLEVKRKDQGQDIQTNPGGAITAPGDGVVKMVQSNPGGFGTAYPVVHFDTGPLAGHDVYLGHTRSALAAGQHFKAGAVLSHTGNGTGPFVGNATGLPGWAELGLWEGGPIRGAETGGRKIAPLLGLR